MDILPTTEAKEISLLAIVLVIIMLASGCATQYRPPQVYDVKAHTLIVADRSFIQAAWNANPAHTRVQVNGFYDEATRTRYVLRDKWHPERPDFAVSGHEEWHLPELGGRFHK